MPSQPPLDAEKLRTATEAVVTAQNAVWEAHEALLVLGDWGLEQADTLQLIDTTHELAGLAENLQRFALSAERGGWPPKKGTNG